MTTTSEPRLEVDEEIEALLSMLDTPAEVAAPDFVGAMVGRDAYWTVAGMLREARRIAALVEQDNAYVARLAAEVERKNAPKMRQLQFLETMIRAHAEELLVKGSKHVDVPGAGRIQFYDRAEYLHVADPDAFMEALGPDERELLVEQRPHLRTREATKYQQAVLETDGGELLPGMERVPAKRTVSIKYEGA